jgi:hypothetical protein
MTFDPTYVSGIGFQHRACFVETGYSDLREDFPDMDQMTREGNNWRNFREAGDLSAMEFFDRLERLLGDRKTRPAMGWRPCLGDSCELLPAPMATRSNRLTSTACSARCRFANMKRTAICEQRRNEGRGKSCKQPRQPPDRRPSGPSRFDASPNLLRSSPCWLDVAGRHQVLSRR